VYFRGAILVTCVACVSTPREADPTSIPAAQSAAEPPIELDLAGPLPQTLSGQVAWQQAGEGDPQYLAVLGRQQGATGLAHWVQGGGRAAAVALQAWPQAPDAFAERARLCRLAARLALPARRLGLQILADTLQSAPPLREEPEPEAQALCRAALWSLHSASLAAEERDLLSVIDARLGVAGEPAAAPSP
jgi:hypothetical protein